MLAQGLTESGSLCQDLRPSESFTPSQSGGGTISWRGDEDIGRSESFPSSHPGADVLLQHADKANEHSLACPPVSPSSCPSNDFLSNELHQLPPSNTPEISSYPQSYHHQPYISEQQTPSQRPQRISLHTTMALMLPTLTNKPLLFQTIHQQYNTVLVVATTIMLGLQAHLLPATSMTAIISHQWRRLQKLIRQQGLLLVLLHLMMWLLQWIIFNVLSNFSLTL